MLPISPFTFASVVSGALRLGHEGYAAYLRGLTQRQDLEVLVPQAANFSIGDRAQSELWVRRWVCEQIEAAEDYLEGRDYPGVFLMNGDGRPARGEDNFPLIAPGGEAQFEEALTKCVLEHQRRHGNGADLSPGEVRNHLVIYHHKVWSDPDNPSPWSRFFRHVVDVGLDVLAVQPGLLGIGGNVQAMLSALAPNLARAFDADDQAGGSLATMLAESFAEASLQTIVDNPDLVTSHERWRPLVMGLLHPLQQEVAVNGARHVFVDNRLRDMITGPMAHGVLTTLSAHANDYLGGRFGQERVLGQVVRETLGVLASGEPEAFNARKLFSQDGAVTVLGAALKVAQQRPEMFIRTADGDMEGDFGRLLLSSIAGKLINAPRPFGVEDGLAPDIASVALGVLGDYASTRLRSAIAGGDATMMGADIATHLVGDLIGGLQNVVSGDGADALGDVFTKSQAIDVLQLMASHVARSPHMIVREGGNPVIAALAENIAAAVASDNTGLLNGEHWRGIVAVALDTALQNPGRLFGLNADGAGQSIALTLIRQVLGTARDTMSGAPGAPGQVLFGETLAEALRVTLFAAGSGALSVINDEAVRARHVEAVGDLMRRVNGLAGSNDARKVVGARDWLEIYSFYIAHVLENGPDAVSALSDDVLLSVLKQPA